MNIQNKHLISYITSITIINMFKTVVLRNLFLLFLILTYQFKLLYTNQDQYYQFLLVSQTIHHFTLESRGTNKL